MRSLRCPNLIGHIVFWHLKAEMHVPEIAERYGLLLELYLEHCGAHRDELLLQVPTAKKVFKMFLCHCFICHRHPSLDDWPVAGCTAN